MHIEGIPFTEIDDRSAGKRLDVGEYSTHWGWDPDDLVHVGVTAGSVTLLRGNHGVGKSTLLLQILMTADIVNVNGSPAQLPVLFLSQEPASQVLARAKRLCLSPSCMARLRYGAILDLMGIPADALDTSKFSLIVCDGGAVLPACVVRSFWPRRMGLESPDCPLLFTRPSEDAEESEVDTVLTLTAASAIELPDGRSVEGVAMLDEKAADPNYRILTTTRNRYGVAGLESYFTMRSTGLHRIDLSMTSEKK